MMAQPNMKDGLLVEKMTRGKTLLQKTRSAVSNHTLCLGITLFTLTLMVFLALVLPGCRERPVVNSSKWGQYREKMQNRRAVHLLQKHVNGSGTVSLVDTTGSNQDNDQGHSLSYTFQEWSKTGQYLLALDVTKADSAYFHAVQQMVQPQICWEKLGYCTISVDAYMEGVGKLCTYIITVFRDYYTVNFYYGCGDETYTSSDEASVFLLKWDKEVVVSDSYPDGRTKYVSVVQLHSTVAPSLGMGEEAITNYVQQSQDLLPYVQDIWSDE